MARWRIAGVLAGLVALAVTTACGPGATASWNSQGGAAGPALGPKLVFSQADKATRVSPSDPISVSVVDGTLDSVTLTNPDGRQVKGAFDDAKTQWKAAEELGYDKTYTLVVSGTGKDGKPLQESRSFTTVKPGNYTLPYLRANPTTLIDGGTFGVGQPIVVWFDEAIGDKAAAERALTVTTDPPTVGAWHWVDSHEVHWRPKEYWQPGTKVTVAANVYGKDLGNGLFGQEDRSASFTIGPSKIAVADSNTHRMKVYISGVQVTNINGNDVTAGIPVSMGRDGGEQGVNGYVDFRTNSGPHVVLGKANVVHMTSASFGLTDKSSPNYYDTTVAKAVQISGDGEYVHLADWNIPQHGVANTSHGCINVAPTYIYWFYDTFNQGDIVDVQNTGRQLQLTNGLGDWTLSWDDWQKGSALAQG